MTLDADSRARAAAVDATRSFIVQAPAGSGKTELLIQRYLMLLASVEQPEEIVAITFTRKAAGEMRRRVLEALEAGAAGTPAATRHGERTVELARTVVARGAERDWSLENDPQPAPAPRGTRRSDA
jgi:ATP-dependent exoDNAse (exonuclease V) beta subunit